MLKLYIFWGILALVLIGVGVSVMSARRRNSRQKVNAAAESAATAVTSTTPKASPQEAPFDPNATRILARGVPTHTSSVLQNRTEATLPTTGIARLVCVGGTQKGHIFPVTAAGITVGRDPQNAIILDDPRVSAHHAWVGIIDNKAILRDLRSSNGTFLNAQIDSPVSEVVLSPGDTIFFGGHSRDQFRFLAD